MAEQFGMAPGMGNFPNLVDEVTSSIMEAVAQAGPRGGCAMQKGDLDPRWDLWDQLRESLQNDALWLGSLADGLGAQGGAVQASDTG